MPSGQGSIWRRRNRPPAQQGSSNGNAANSQSLSSLEPGSDQYPPTANPTARDILSSGYARKRRELMDLTASLRSIGVHRAGTIIDVPRIVVIGGQSAGKSSLVEAVTGINVPRDSGTCTRCPMECTIASTSSTWSCKISLRFDYDSTTEEPLPLPSTVPFGPERITDKSLVEIWLWRAQVAILSPHVEMGMFLDMNSEQLKTFMKVHRERMKKFEKNKVCIHIEDPDATDLAFVDLPGLIQNESKETIDLVRTLVESNIQEENTIILVTIPISDDIENQQSVLLAKQADPDGHRTIGATSARQKWKDILEGREHPLRHGYYCVRLPDDDERASGISRVEAVQNAKHHLDSTAPWSEITNRGRFGIQNLITDVSKLLMHFIEAALPKIKDDINKLLTDTIRELSSLPEPPLSSTANATSEILLRVTEFSNLVKVLIYGGGDDKTLIQRNRETYKRFKAVIRMSAPDFRPFVGWNKYYEPNWAQLPCVEDPTIEEDEERDPTLQVEPMDLHDVRDVINSSIDWHLPNHVPFDANKVLIKRSIDMWGHHVLRFFDEVSHRLDKTVGELVTKQFSQFNLLEALIRVSVKKELNRVKQAAKNETLKTLKLEYSLYLTQNDHYLNSNREKWFRLYTMVRKTESSYLKSAPRERLWYPQQQDPAKVLARPTSATEHRVLADLASLGYSVTLNNLARLHPPDEFEQELIIMANVRAYFQVAYKRIIDLIPLTIEHSLNQAFSDELQSYLYRELGVGRATEESMRDLLSENPEIAKRRDELTAKERLLLDIQEKMSNFDFR